MGWVLPNSHSSQLLWLVVLCSFLLVSCFSSSPPTILCKSEEKTALLGFQSHFSSNKSLDNCSDLSWKEDDEDCCEWNGVTCDNATGYVIGLDLQSESLCGNIPLDSSLFNLIHLQKLYLSRNNFNNSQISHSFRNFRNLTELFLQENRFPGVVPSEIFLLPKLQILDLSWNGRLTGELPDSIGELGSLQKLVLGECDFSGSIPASLGNLTQLSVLNITNNNFSGLVPASLSNLPVLDLSYNNLEGPIHHFILNCALCLHLDFSGNSFTDTIDLDLFRKLQNLDFLDLSNSGLSLTIGNSNVLSAFPIIRHLGLSSCKLSTNILTNLSAQSILEYIDLSNNSIMAKLDTSICNLDSLYYLDLSHNQLDGIIPDCLGNSTGTLSILNLQSNKFLGTIPQSFGYSKSIQLLDLSNNLLQGSLPRSLVNCTEIKVLNLGGNMLMDGFPFWLGSLSSLKVLILRENRLYGTITGNLKKEQGHFANMHIIDMSQNLLTGTFPSGYFDCWNAMTRADEEDMYSSITSYVSWEYYNRRSWHSKNIRWVYESVVDMSGNKSATIGDGEGLYGRLGYDNYYSLDIMNKRVPNAMKIVDFSSNKFHGSIPPSIGRLKGIRVLNLSGNALIGRVPWFLENLTNLESLDLSDNMLSGEIPQNLISLNFLEVLGLSRNNLTGLIPVYLEKFPNTSFEGNPGLCGLPLSRLCSSPTQPNSSPPKFPIHKNHHFKFEINDFGWEVVLVGYGCGLVFGLGIGSFIVLKKKTWVHRAFRLKVR